MLLSFGNLVSCIRHNRISIFINTMNNTNKLYLLKYYYYISIAKFLNVFLSLHSILKIHSKIVLPQNINITMLI